MGIINVEGLGEVQITGDKPNEEEQKIILETLEKMPASDKDINDKTDSFVKSNAFGRLAIEVGLGIGGSLLTGGAALPALALSIRTSILLPLMQWLNTKLLFATFSILIVL